MAESTVEAPAASADPNVCYTDKHTVVLIEDRTYRVETRLGRGSQCVDTLTVSFHTALCARLVQRTIADCLRANMSEDETREELFEALRYAYANEDKASYRDALFLADMDRAMRIFTPVATLGRMDARLAELADSLAGVR